MNRKARRATSKLTERASQNLEPGQTAEIDMCRSDGFRVYGTIRRESPDDDGLSLVHHIVSKYLP